MSIMTKAQKNDLRRSIEDTETSRDTLNDIVADLQSKYDERSERWQESDKGKEFQEFLANLDSAVDAFDDAINGLSECEEG